jgi:hypothetical protein
MCPESLQGDFLLDWAHLSGLQKVGERNLGHQAPPLLLLLLFALQVAYQLLELQIEFPKIAPDNIQHRDTGWCSPLQIYRGALQRPIIISKQILA